MTKITLLSNVKDVIISSPLNGQTLIYSGGYWRNASGVSGGHVIQEEGSSLPQRSKLNFVGTGITAIDDSINDRTNVMLSGITSGHIIQDEGITLNQRRKLNFIGAGITVIDNPGNDSSDVTVSVSGGGHTIAFSGNPMPQRATLNFIGSIVTVIDDSVNNRTTVNISGDILKNEFLRRLWFE